MDNDWTDDIETILEDIRINAVLLSKEHSKSYFSLKNNLQYYRLPVIILSGFNSIISVGTQPYLPQPTISIMTCLIALVCSIIGSIELYLSIQKSMELELTVSKEYYLLAVDIFKVLALKREHRPIPAKDYLEARYNEYRKLKENSNLILKKIEDKLCPLEDRVNISASESPVGVSSKSLSDWIAPKM
jgi:hypothetical protein